MGAGKNWTAEEYEYLKENWGYKSIPAIARHLDRSKSAIKIKAVRLNLGAALDNGDWITWNQFLKAVTGRGSSDGYKMKSWVENRDFPIHEKRVDECKFKVVYISEFWKWAEKNRSFIDFSKMEPLILGKEPDWAAEQRKKDFYTFALQRKVPWTQEEDDRLKILLSRQKYGYAELSEMLKRSEGAIQRRCLDLGIKSRPVKADTHGLTAAWTAEMYEIVANGIKDGEGYFFIAQKIGKSEKAVRGKVYSVYFTENLDKVREMIGSGRWGSGAPEPTLRQAKNLSQYRSTYLKEIAALIGCLQYRKNQLGYGEYWQKDMCMNWDDTARKKKAQRHWARVNKTA